MKLWGRTTQMVVGTGNKPMKASCIGAASMTSGFGPSYQECLWLCRKAKSLNSPPSRRILCYALEKNTSVHCILHKYGSSWKKKKKKNNSFNQSINQSFIIIQPSQHFGSSTEQRRCAQALAQSGYREDQGFIAYLLASFLPYINNDDICIQGMIGVKACGFFMTCRVFKCGWGTWWQVRKGRYSIDRWPSLDLSRHDLPGNFACFSGKWHVCNRGGPKEGRTPMTVQTWIDRLAICKWLQ